eukprot:1052702-Prymnesium_polylepis.1
MSSGAVAALSMMTPASPDVHIAPANTRHGWERRGGGGGEGWRRRVGGGAEEVCVCVCVCV